MSEVVITVKTLDGIRNAVNKLAKKINAPENLLPSYSSLIDHAYEQHVEVDSQGLHLIVNHGKSMSKKTTNDPHELLYWIFEHVTSEMARRFYLKNRIESQDSRRIYFQKQEELLGELDSSWRKRKEEEHSRTLQQYPYDDNVSLRVEFYKELIAKGYSAEEADKLSDERYPLPLAPKPNRQG